MNIPKHPKGRPKDGAPSLETRVVVYTTFAQQDRLEKLASQHRVSVSDVIRCAVERFESDVAAEITTGGGEVA